MVRLYGMEKIVAGEKTQVRLPFKKNYVSSSLGIMSKSDMGRPVLMIGQTHEFAGTGAASPSKGRVKIVDVAVADSPSILSQEDLLAEGYSTMEGFTKEWCKTYSKIGFFRPCVVVTFELVMLHGIRRAS